MIRNLAAAIFFIFFVHLSYGQRLNDIKRLDEIRNTSPALRNPVTPDKTKKGTNPFLNFYIPSAILFTGLEPAGLSKLNLSFGDDKVEFKYGRVFKEDKVDGALNTSGGIKISATAPQGARSLFAFDKTPHDFDGTLIYTWVTEHEAPFIQVGAETIYTGRKGNWLNVNGTAGRAKRILFQNISSYTEDFYNNANLMLTYNWFRNHWGNDLNVHKVKSRHITSISAGVGSYDNYQDLADLTLRTGSIDSINNRFSEEESVAGKLGKFKRTTGALLSASFFKPLTKFDSKTSIHWGTNINSFGLGSNNHRINSNTGFYISKRSFTDEDEQKELKEDFSFGILADFRNLLYSEEAFLKNNFRILLTAQIPLRFQ